MSDLKKRIKAVDDIQKEVVHVDEWGEDIEVRGMDGIGRAEFMKNAYDEDGKPIISELWPEMVMATCYETGTDNKLFGPDDKEWLIKKNGRALSKLALVGMKLSGISDEARTDIKNGSSAEQNEDSTSL